MARRLGIAALSQRPNLWNRRKTHHPQVGWEREPGPGKKPELEPRGFDLPRSSSFLFAVRSPGREMARR
jgi:hypothetical protein